MESMSSGPVPAEPSVSAPVAPADCAVTTWDWYSNPTPLARLRPVNVCASSPHKSHESSSITRGRRLVGNLSLELRDPRVALPKLSLLLLDPVVAPVTLHEERNARSLASWKAQIREWNDIDHLRVRRPGVATPVNGYPGGDGLRPH